MFKIVKLNLLKIWISAWSYLQSYMSKVKHIFRSWRSWTLFLRKLQAGKSLKLNVPVILCFKSPRVTVSVADPGCLSRIPDPNFLPIPDPESKNSYKREGWKNFFWNIFFCSHKFHKIENFLFLKCWRKKNWASFQRIIKLLPQNLSLTSQKIWVWEPGSGKT